MKARVAMDFILEIVAQENEHQNLLTARCVRGRVSEEDYTRLAVSDELGERCLFAILSSDLSAEALKGDAVADSGRLGFSSLGGSFGSLRSLLLSSSLGRSSFGRSGLGCSSGRLFRLGFSGRCLFRRRRRGSSRRRTFAQFDWHFDGDLRTALGS